jgi:uncharacterized protein
VTWLQHWTDVLFLHFALAPEQLAQRVPKNLEIDTFNGQAWLSLVFFRLQLRPAGLPFLPGLSSLLELNVRTYVRHRDRPGIVFLRMYADNWLAIRAARLLTPLCYEPATMHSSRSPDGCRHIACAPEQKMAGQICVDFEISGNPSHPAPSSLDSWLLERYRLFVPTPTGPLLAAQVEHPPWQASPVIVRAMQQTLDGSLGLPLGPSDLARYSPGVAATFRAFHSAFWDVNPHLAPALERKKVSGCVGESRLNHLPNATSYCYPRSVRAEFSPT